MSVVTKPLEIGEFDYWLFALCALGSGLKKIRESVLVPGIKKISGLLVDLREKGLINLENLTTRRVPNGVFSEDVAGWIYRTNGLLSMAGNAEIATDKFEEDYLLINPAARELFLLDISLELRFADQAKRDQMFRIAIDLGEQANQTLIDIGLYITRQLIEASKATSDKKLQTFLIPLACHMLFESGNSWKVLSSEVARAIPKHKASCTYCRECLARSCGADWEKE